MTKEEMLRKPLWVKVIWSESSKFKDNELIQFSDFEKKCANVSRKVGVNNGYDKTKINVLFDDGEEYECRLDLSMSTTQGFEHHAKQFISWYKKLDDDSSKQDAYADYYNFLTKIEWPASA